MSPQMSFSHKEYFELKAISSLLPSFLSKIGASISFIKDVSLSHTRKQTSPEITLTTWEDSHLYVCACMHAQSLQSRPTLCDPMDCSPPGSAVHGILQARILEWVAMPFSRDLPDLGIEPVFLMSPELAGGFLTSSATWEAPYLHENLTKQFLFSVHFLIIFP